MDCAHCDEARATHAYHFDGEEVGVCEACIPELREVMEETGIGVNLERLSEPTDVYLRRTGAPTLPLEGL
jgi:hypothetical protein